MTQTRHQEVIKGLLFHFHSKCGSPGQMLNNEASSRNKVFSQLRRLGFKDINDNNIDKYRSLLNQEIENKPDEKSEIEKLNENQNTRHTEIVDLFKSVVDELRAITKTFDRIGEDPDKNIIFQTSLYLHTEEFDLRI